MEEKREKGRRWVISTREEMREAVIDVAREATRKVSIFTHDLEPGIYDDPDFLEVIKRLVLSQTYARIRVLIADPTRAIKADAHTASIPIIALTAHATAEDRRQAFEAGCDDYDTKPVDLARLLKKIEDLLSKN